MALTWKQTFDANPTTTFNANDIFYLARSPYTVTENFGFTYSSLIPPNTKGDLFSWSTAAAKLAVGATNGMILQVNSAATTGLAWSTTTYPVTSTLGGLVYGSATNAYSNLTGNITTTKQYLSQTGSGAVSAAPAWATIAGADIAGFTAGSVIFASSTGTLTQDNANFFWDATNHRLGIGNAAPSTPLHVTGVTTTTQLNCVRFNNTISEQVLGFTSAVTPVNYFNMQNTAANNGPNFSVLGTDSNIDMILTTKGTGKLQLVTAALTSPIQVLSGTSSQHTANFAFANAATTQTITFPDGDGTVLFAGPTAPFTTVTGTSASMAVDNGYIANNAGLVTLTLPTTAVAGDVIYVLGLGAGGWKIAQNASQLIHVGSLASTTGVGGSVASTNAFDTITIRCLVANTTWSVMASQTSGFTVV